MNSICLSAVLTTFFLSLAVLSADEPRPVFFWDMESEKATSCKPGSDDTPTYAADAKLSSEEAFAGDASLRLEGPWAAATFDNNSNEVVWAPVTEGTIELFWQYHAPWGDQMLFQITGKSSTKDKRFDTNDGVGLRTRGQNPGEFFCAAGARNHGKPIKLEEGRWYRFRVRYKHDRGISLQIDDGPQFFSTAKSFGPTECKAWHQILIGNDRKSEMVLNIDNFAVYDHWLEDDAPAASNEEGKPEAPKKGSE